MSTLDAVPDLADGGYWYVTPTVIDADQGKSPGIVAGVGWCAWYGVVGGVEYAAVRCPQAVTGFASTSITTSEVLASAAAKPYGRVGGA
jgi:hypothetical protein